MTDDSPLPAARRLLVFFGVGLLLLGALALFFPGPVLRGVDIPVTSPTASADLRALYGGVPLTVGILLLYALREPSWWAPCLALAMATTGGPALARLYSIAVSGTPNRLVLVYLVLEALGFLWALSVYRRFSAWQQRALQARG